MPAKRKPLSDQGPRKGAHLMDQFGIGMNMNQFESMLYDDDDDDNDEELEAELAALQGEDLPRKKEKTKRKNLVRMEDINKMAAESLRDIPSDEEVSDTEDPELLLELSNLTEDSPSPPPIPSRTSAPAPPPRPIMNQPPSPVKSFQAPPAEIVQPQDMVSLLTERIALYRTAYENASAASDTSKQRRLNRGIKTLQELLRKAQAGRPIDGDSIPPPVTVKVRAPASSIPTPAKVPTPEDYTPPESVSQPTVPSLPAQNVVSPSAPSPVSPISRSGEISSPTKAPSNLESPGRRPPAPGAIPVLPTPAAAKPRDFPEAKSPTPLARSPAKPSPPPPTSQREPPAPPQASKPVSTAIPNISNLSASDQKTHHLLRFRRDQYRSCAITAKHSGDIRTATKYAHSAKQFDFVIKALEDGKPIDLSKMPPPPPGCPEQPVESVSTANPIPQFPVEKISPASKEAPTPPQPSNTKDNISSIPPLSTNAEKKLYNAPDQPSTVIEALNQRMAKYKSCEDEAKASGSSSKARRMGRIVKQYQDAIKMYKAGKAVNFEELPTPPGFGPIPTNNASAPTASAAPAAVGPAASPVAPPAAKEAARVPAQPQMRQQQAPKTGEQISEGEIRKRAFARRSISSRQEQQVTFLKERMAEYRAAAIQAKKENNMELAKAYLRQAKGFEPMLEAAEGGLPVDLTKVPPPLNMDDDYEDKFVFVNPEDCEISGDRDEVYQKLQESLVSQIQMCSTTSKHFTKMGDVLSASRFQKLEQSCTKDLDSLKNAYKHGDPVPRFHYETKTFSMVQCNSELGDNDLELTIVRGIKFNLPSGYAPKDLDTYIKFEFPFPTDDPQTHTTETVKDTDSPEYGESFKLNINRRSRALLRVFEKKSLKLEVYYRRGFLKSDKILGTISVKLQPLESKCTIHDSFDLMDGRKSVGGKLEVKLKLRDPLKNKQVEEVKEKWLIIDKFLQKINEKEKRTEPAVGLNRWQKIIKKQEIKSAEKQDQKASSGSTSMEVLKYEKQQLDKQITHLKDSLTSSQLQILSNKSKLLQEKIEKQHSFLRTGGKAAFKAYLIQLEKDTEAYTVDAQVSAKKGDMQKAQLFLTKRKLAEKEIATIKEKIPDIC